MLSKKIASLKGFLSLYEEGGLSTDEVGLIQNLLSDLHAQALILEQAIIAPVKRLDRKQLERGNIAILPIIPMPGRW